MKIPCRRASWDGAFGSPLIVERSEDRPDIGDVDIETSGESRQRWRYGGRDTARTPSEEPIDGATERLAGARSLALDECGYIVVERDRASHDVATLASRASERFQQVAAPKAFLQDGSNRPSASRGASPVRIRRVSEAVVPTEHLEGVDAAALFPYLVSSGAHDGVSVRVYHAV